MSYYISYDYSPNHICLRHPGTWWSRGVKSYLDILRFGGKLEVRVRRSQTSDILLGIALLSGGLASAKANLVRVGHYEVCILKPCCFVIGGQDLGFVQTTPSSISQPRANFARAAPASPGNRREVECLHALGECIVAAGRPAAKTSFDRACRVGA